MGLVEAPAGVVIEEKGGVVVIPTNADASKINPNVAASIGYTISGSTITPSEEKLNSSYYMISNLTELYYFVEAWNSGTEILSVKFVKDLVLDVSSKEWDPIGTWEYPYHGTIDGMGCTISGLTQTSASNKSIWSTGSSTGYKGNIFGFIGIAGSGDVKVSNINFTNVNINISTGSQVGTVIGYAPKNGDFTDPTKGGDYWYKNGATAVSGKKELPINYGKGNITLENINVSGIINAKNHVGGLIGKVYNTGKVLISGCSNMATVSGESEYVAGLIGYANGQSEITFKKSKNFGNISVQNNSIIGGFINLSAIMDAPIRFEECINGPNVTFNSSKHADFVGLSQNAHFYFIDCTSNNISDKNKIVAIEYSGGNNCKLTISGVTYQYAGSGAWNIIQ